MARPTRKGRNPGLVDDWLDTLGYYRKNVAFDETCLFRSVSEQLYACQLFHEEIRKTCVLYARAHRMEFEEYLPNDDVFEEHINKLQKHMAVCGSLEIQIISRAFKRGVMIFNGLTRCMSEVTTEKYSEYLLLCHMGEDHYDAVYKREYIQEAGFCQSIVYNTLYENVFGITDIDKIVQSMLYQKPSCVVTQVNSIEEKNSPVMNKPATELIELQAISTETPEEGAPKSDESGQIVSEYEHMLRNNVAPFSFKVAKALDPTIYRNIEYDTWTEMRKELRLGNWYYGDSNLIQGAACTLHDNGDTLKCYIQEILSGSRAVVYITSRAEKRTVSLAELQPEENAKPWPLPYRFSKNAVNIFGTVITVPKLELPDRKTLKKRREKKRTTSKCSNESEQLDASDSALNVYEGAPLQMQLENKHKTDLETVNNETAEFNYSEFTWDMATPLPPVTDSSEQVAWSDVPTASPNSYRTTIFTSPEATTSRYYNQTDQSYNRYGVWPHGEYVAPLSAGYAALPSPQMSEYMPSPDAINFYFSDGSYSPAYSSSTIPPSPQGVYIPVAQPVYASAPLTPVILTAPLADGVEVVTPTTPILYSPLPMDMPHFVPSPYVYPPTPPVSWVPVNSRGFVYPTPGGTTNGA